MGLAIREPLDNRLGGVLSVDRIGGSMGEADVAMAAIGVGMLAEVVEQQALTAGVSTLGIVEHGLDAVRILTASVVIDFW